MFSVTRPLKHIASAALAALCVFTLPAMASEVTGTVLGVDLPVVGARVSLWRSAAGQSPAKLREVVSAADGRFTLRVDPSNAAAVHYVVTEGGRVNGQEAPALKLMAVLPAVPPARITINELTTVGSVWPNAQLLDGDKLRGTPVGLKIGRAQVPNLVDVGSGGFGRTVLDGSNLAQSETVGRMNTLVALVALCGRHHQEAGCKEFLRLTNSSDTLDALQTLARQPWVNAPALFELFSSSYPFPERAGRRKDAPVPYLQYPPEDFALIVRFMGGGIYSPGKLAFDQEGNLWSGLNWMAGAQNSLYQSIGGGVVKLSPSGDTLSPSITGFTIPGLDGIGWGTGISSDKVWASSFARTIAVFDLKGKPLTGPAGINFDGKLGMMHGVGYAPNGDVWIVDSTGDKLVHFPGGDPQKGRLVEVAGLAAPFAITIDRNNVVWVSNSGGATVVRFPGDAPEKAQSLRAGISVRGIALDSKGNLWAGSNFTPGDPLPEYPKGVGILQQFLIGAKFVEDKYSVEHPTGVITVFDKDGKTLLENVGNRGIFAPWGVSIDGQDNAWVAGIYGMSLNLYCGMASQCPAGTKPGDLIHKYRSGVLQMPTDAVIDSAGNVWVANNWNDPKALTEKNPDRYISTKGGGTGILIVYGVAKPVINPLQGEVRAALP
ncbi:Vgb family protein [Variovorax ginsengisoli]|uniref:NHL repeat containing protein n=1 Tax=Variovorax ginsengisoli TaxID=363844 RepID=A0ABT8S8N4_9BURK|nr:hypothetical protein [Variovorax ginsengisoli]MDN8615673.1 hypothetical protein [Variovorax ginsengisoli]MDO1534843.1 hypothetical protein [Variovorax ginsengisoli]